MCLPRDRREVHPVAGWLTQEGYLYDVAKEEMVEYSDPLGPDRRVVPGVVLEGYGWEVRSIDDLDPTMWVILGPGENDPSEEEEAAERARRSAPS